jgi:hypothetical protein
LYKGNRLVPTQRILQRIPKGCDVTRFIVKGIPVIGIIGAQGTVQIARFAGLVTRDTGSIFGTSTRRASVGHFFKKSRLGLAHSRQVQGAIAGSIITTRRATRAINFKGVSATIGLNLGDQYGTVAKTQDQTIEDGIVLNE